MAGSILARRLTSCTLPKLRSPLHHQQVNSTRAFASAAAKAQDGSAVEVGRSSRNQDKAVSTQSRGPWPGSSFPSLFSPMFNFPSSLLRPTSLMQMMDTVDHLFSAVEPPTVSALKSRMPWDVAEDDKCFKMRLDLPGMTKEDVKLSVEDGDLVVKAEHKAEEGEDEWSTRSYGSYSARIKLPENVDVNGIKAEMKDGVLKVRSPKVQGEKQKHEVQIE